MYRTLGTRGSVFGVASGPYAGKERLVSFGRLSPAAKARLIDALAGRGQLAPILRPAPTRQSFILAAVVGVLAGLYALFGYRWPAAQGAPFALAYVGGALLLALLAHRRARALSYDGTTIAAGAYLFPLDVIEANRDGTLRLVPLGGVREAAVGGAQGTAGSGPSLVLTFKDGSSRAFPVKSEREAESAYAALESAQQTLEKLTYGRDLADAVNLDPFFEVRIDDSWESVSLPRAVATRARTLATFALAGALGLALFFGRSALAHVVRGVERARRSAEIAALEARLAEQEREKAEEKERAASDPADSLAAPDRPARGPAGDGLAAYQALAPNKQVGELVARAATTGQGLSFYFAHTMKPCAACTATLPSEQALGGMEHRIVEAFQSVLSETIPRDSLPLRIVSAPPSPPALVVEYAISPMGKDPQDFAMTFDVRLTGASDAEPITFRLTMPPPAAPLTQPRERSLFSLGASPTEADLVYARGFDRLYDEIYGLFFAGAPRVPLPGAGAAELRRTFGGP